MTIRSLLAETGGAGELVDRVADGPVRLTARPGGRPTAGTFESSAGPGEPRFSMTLKRRTDGLVEFALRVTRPVLSQEPALCSEAQPSSTPLTTRFAIDDGVHPPVEIATQQSWECVGRAPRTGRDLRVR